MQLTDKIYSAIESLSKEGNDLMDDDKYEEAITKWTQALNLLPTPKAEWEAFMWLSASIGDAHYQQKRYALARNNFQDALNAPGGVENPFVHFRLGQCQLALGNTDPGVNSLLKAYMLDGEEIFLSDAGGATYLKLLKDHNLIK